MSIKPFGKGKGLPHGSPGHARDRRRVLGNVILVLIISVILASTSPEPIRAAAVASFLLFVSIGVAVSAAIRREQAFVPHVTRWDLAILFYACSVIANGFVDEEAVRALVEQAQQSGSVFSGPAESTPYSK